MPPDQRMRLSGRGGRTCRRSPSCLWPPNPQLVRRPLDGRMRGHRQPPTPWPEGAERRCLQHGAHRAARPTPARLVHGLHAVLELDAAFLIFQCDGRLDRGAHHHPPAARRLPPMPGSLGPARDDAWAAETGNPPASATVRVLLDPGTLAYIRPCRYAPVCDACGGGQHRSSAALPPPRSPPIPPPPPPPPPSLHPHQSATHDRARSAASEPPPRWLARSCWAAAWRFGCGL
jgi:hypothetical protein